ncbi:type II secretion system protein [Lentibacillus cibarius]|uniref:Type II secretion system protein n=1 Tax=Lentibacillus cibarius TaxID=2583219 RepID=A0A5S3QGE5_9BACI|nr:type II secretion system protein [Lentibacillus cibarius]TMN20960.1 type II secretion system protein [Lentibacillus cibarius]
MKNNKGFTLIETIVATSLVMMVIVSLIPAVNILSKERMSLQQKRSISNELHSELQSYVWTDRHPRLPVHFVKEIKGVRAVFSFTAERELLKGCVTWTNAQKREEKLCLYGYPAK